MLKKTKRILYLYILAVLVAALASCGGVGAAPINGDPLAAVAVSVTPPSVAMRTSAVQTFTATVTNSNMTTVNWLVNGISGGNSTFGTVDKKGNYTAPTFVPIPATVTVTAVANADETKSASATVSISGSSVPGSTTIAPKTASVVIGDTALFTATVAGSNKAVTWEVNGQEEGNSAVGTITPIAGSNDQATYTAPLLVPDSGQVTVTATSVAHPEQSASAVVTVTPPPKGGAVVKITDPLTPPTVQAGQTQAFQATVKGVSNTAVSWQVDGIPGGNASVGTIASGADDTATFTAPRLLPSPPTVTVVAVSKAQPSAQASLVVNLIPVQAVTVTVSPDPCANPSAVPINSSVQFTAVVTGNKNQDVTWQVNGATGGNSQIGTISGAGVYTAPADVPNPAGVTVSAYSDAVPAVSGKQNITISQNPVLQVQLAPVPSKPPAPYPDIPVGDGQEFQATVLGATDVSQAEVNWLINGYPDGDGGIYGTIDSPPLTSGCTTTGQYSAPLSIPSPSTFPVTAQSAYQTTASQSINITIIAAPQVTVNVDPSSADVPQTTQQVFNAQIQGTSDPNAYWSLSSSQCTGAACGTLNPTGPSPSTTYTAPAQGTPSVTLTAKSEADPSALGTANITVTCGGPPSISIYPSSATIQAGSASPLSFAPIISPCGNQSVNVSWQLGCISLYNGDPGEDCYDSNPVGGGPGCTQINNGFKVCGDRANDGSGVYSLDYFAPHSLYTNDFAANVCEPTNNGSGDGLVPLTATVQLQGCPQQGCQATACITVTPP
ncbi:MAG TPA: hypothetical protein VF753_14200 [Terriglobales bacterium]